MDDTANRERLQQLAAEIAVRLRACSTVDDLCEMVGATCHELLTDDAIVVSLFDPELDAITIRSHHGLGALTGTALEALGSDPRHMSFSVGDMTSEERALFCSGRLEEIQSGIYGMLTRRVPRSVCSAAQRLLRVERVWAIGFALDDVPYGGVTILRRSREAPPEAPLIELLSAMVSLAIRQRRAEHERSSLERQLQRAQKLEAIGKLAGGVAHDFNNTLQTIMSLSELMKRDLSLDHPHRAHLAELLDAAASARSLTRSLLAVGRRQMLKLEPLDLGRLAGEVRQMLHRTLHEGIRVVCRVPEAPVWIRGDRAELERAILDLAINAQDAMPNGGELRIEIESHAGKERSLARLLVGDTGCGMTPEIVEQVFDPFFTTKPSDQGSGLGLAAVHGIIGQHGGSMEVESFPGRGTLFRIELPLSSAPGSEVRIAAGTAPERTPDEAARPSGRILLVEDSTIVRRTINRLLASRGWEVLEASNGAEALRVWKDLDRPPEILLSDVVMPVMDGLELVERLKAEQPGMPAVLMSGYSTDLSEGDRLPPGVRFISKPFSGLALAELLDELVGGPAQRR
ncbi:MAG: ATP-binding protein [Polyangia bacterium]